MLLLELRQIHSIQASEVSTCTDAAVRNNIIVIMSDFCSRYVVLGCRPTILYYTIQFKFTFRLMHGSCIVFFLFSLQVYSMLSLRQTFSHSNHAFSSYTTVMDSYVQVFIDRLRDENPLVRRTTLTTITMYVCLYVCTYFSRHLSSLLRLLREDYMKVRGGLLHRLLISLTDPDHDIRNLGKYGMV